jgi:uncharacterized membrane protein YgdD (TMEM256/DUF423 family)
MDVVDGLNQRRTPGKGAFGAHGLKNFLDAYGKSIFGTAVLYQMFHTLALLG